MSVRETLELDVRPALTSVNQLDKALAGTTAKLKTGLAEATKQLEPSGAATASVTGLAKAVDTAGESATKAAGGFSTLEQSASRTIVQAKAGEGSFLGLSRVVNQAGQAALIAGGAIEAALALGVKAASSVQDAFIPIGTLLGANSVQARNLSNALRDVIANSPESAQELGLSAYTILSAGISGTANVIKTLKASQQLAEAGLGGLAQATDLVTSAVNSFSTENLSATKAAQLFFGTIAAGKTTTQGLAEGFGQVAPLAAATGVRFRELLSATAALTSTGQQASVAYTGLRGILTNVLRPSADAANVARQLGIDFSAAGLASKGLAGFLTDIGEKAGGNVEILSKLFGSVEGVNAVLALTGPQAKAFAANLAGIDAAGANLTKRAAEVRDSFGNQLKTAFNQAQIALEKVFAPFLPIIGTVARGAADIAEGFSSIPLPVQQSVVGIAGLSGGLLLLTGAVTRLAVPFSALQGFLRGFAADGSLADRATTALGNNLGVLARGAAGLGTFFALGPQLAELTGEFTASGAAAGALAGTLVSPGLGTVVGAAIGAIAGKVGLLGSSADDATGKILSMSKVLGSLAAQDAANRFLEQFLVNLRDLGRIGVFGDTATLTKLTGDIDKVAGALRALATKDPGAAKNVLDGLTSSAKLTDAEWVRLTVAVAKGTETFKAHVVAGDKAAKTNKALADTALAEADATDAATKAHDDYVAGLVRGLPTVTGFFDEATGKIKDFTAATDPKIILQNFQDQLTNVRDFTIRVQQLLDAGLTELARIAVEKGPIAGAAIAEAFVEADPATQRALNDTAAGIRTKLTDLSNFISGPYATSLFGASATAGGQIGSGLASGITASTPEAQQAAADIAAGVQQSIEFLLGIQSPSRVMFGIGVLVAQGLALGMEAGAERFVTPAGRRLTLRAVIPTISSSGAPGIRPAGSAVPGSLIGNLIVQAPIPTPVAVGVESARRLRAEMYLQGL